MSSSNDTLKPRLLLPIALALVVLKGGSLPWITVRTFSGNERVYNLADLRGGMAVIMTIALVVFIGASVGIFKRLTGMTIMSLGVAALGWMAAISGILLSLLWSLIPAINVAGFDLAKATLGQGSGVVVTVVASLSLAFMVVRQLQPFKTYAPSTHLPVLPIVALIPLLAITVCMHSEWLRLGKDGSGVQAQVAGDSLYGSGLVVLALWLAIGLWIGALMVNRSLMISIASGLTVVVSMIVGVYAVFLWAGGKLLDWLVPAKLEKWTAVSIEPQLYVVLGSTVLLFTFAILGLFSRTHSVVITLGSRTPGAFRLYYSDVLGGAIIIFLVLNFVLRVV